MVDIKAKPFFLSDAQAQWVERTLAGMSVEEKVGQLFVVMGGDFAPEALADRVRRGRVGGVLFRPESAQAIRERYAPLDAAAAIPLLKAANLEEGGAGAITDGTLFGWPMLVSASPDEEDAARFGRVCAAEGRSVGVNWTFSPVCDIDMNSMNPITNVRTFGSDPERVTRRAERFMRAVQESGMAACAKHFPGDGVDDRNQHLHPTYNTLSAQQWRETYGRVYRRLIDGGLMSVMAGHIVQPALEMEKNPALTFADCLPGSLSPELLTGVLRDELGFNGVIATDATIMGGYCMAMERCRAIPASIAAGCDMLVFTTDADEDFSYLMEGVRSGQVSAQRLDDAVTRVLALKAKVCAAPPCAPAPEAAQWHRECAGRAVTLVKQTQPDALPVTPARYPQVRLIALGRRQTPDGDIADIAGDWLRREGFDVELYDPFEDELHGTSRLPRGRLTLYLANYEQASNQTTVRIRWCEKHALDAPRFVNEETCVMVSLANPYLLRDAPRIRTYVNAYTATRATIEAALERLCGRVPFTGESPVDAFCGRMDTRL